MANVTVCDICGTKINPALVAFYGNVIHFRVQINPDTDIVTYALNPERELDICSGECLKVLALKYSKDILASKDNTTTAQNKPLDK